MWTVGHPEAVTLPRTLAGLKNSANVMTGPASLMKSIAQIRDAIDAGELTIEEAAAMLSQPASEEMKLAAAEEVQHSTQLPPLFALAIGQKNGVPHRAGAMALGSPAGGMGGVTGIPLALGLPLLAQ